MEFRDRLLSSEIRHVTDLVNMLSYELVIIQDFMQQQFGLKFKKFRERHLLSYEVRHESNNKSTEKGIPRTNNNRETNVGHERTKRADPIVVNENSTAEANLEGISLIDTSQVEVGGFDETKFNNDEEMSFEGGFDENPGDADDSDFDYTEKNVDGMKERDDIDTDFDSDESDVGNRSKINKVEPGGRKKIWSRFDCTRLPGGKKIVRCRKCRQQVSAVPKRLERHYDLCVLGKRLDPVSTIKLKKEPISGEPERKGKKPLGIVWKYFNKVTNADGHVVVTCKFCEKKVSNHATRMSRHLQNCSKSPDTVDIESSQ